MTSSRRSTLLLLLSIIVFAFEAFFGALPSLAMLDKTDHSAAPDNIAEAFGLQPPAPGQWWNQANGITVDQISSSIPANILVPGDKLTAAFQVRNESGQPLDVNGFLEVRRYDLTTASTDFFKYAIHNLGICGTAPATVHAGAGKTVEVTCDVPVPAAFGGYALILDLGQAGGRHLAGLCIRTLSHRGGSDPYPVMTLDERDHTFLERLGIHAIRTFIVYKPTTAPDYPEYLDAMKKNMDDLVAHHITAMVGFQGNEPEYTPLGTWAHKLNDQNQMILPGNDTMWMPSYDPDFTKFVHDICGKYGWPRGPVTAVCLYNEPWEGGGISGWASDLPRYREAYKAMADGVLAARADDNVKVLVGGCDSTGNALDKLFPDGSNTFLPIFDFVSMHYQGLDSYATFPLWRDRTGPLGRVRFWDTESWVANTDDRILPLLASWRAAGYDRVMGVDANAACENRHVTLYDENGLPRRNPDGSIESVALAQPSSVAAAESAAASFLGDRPFRQILFRNGLPWVFVFDGLPDSAGKPDPEDGVVVVAGDIGAGDRTRFRSVESLAQEADKRKLRVELAQLSAAGGNSAGSSRVQELQREIDAHVPVSGAQMILAASPDYALYDDYGNRQPAVGGAITIPLNVHGYFLRGNGSPGSFGKLLAALRQARIEGLDPVEVIASDMTRPIDQHPALTFTVTNVLNRPIHGVLAVSSPGLKLRPATQSITIAPNETKQLPVTVASGDVARDNCYPVTATFDAGVDGAVTHVETMHCNVISHRTITVDGDLSDWTGVLPQTVSAGSGAPSIMESAWYPGRNFETTGAGGDAVAYLAYDAQNFYFAAKVSDNTPDPGTMRFADRDDDSFFFPETVTVRSKDNPKLFTALYWPANVRRYIYRKDPVLPAGNGQGATDNIQIGFNVIPEDDAKDKGMYPYPPGAMPRYIGFKDTDYEYALNLVAPQYGGGTEVWRLLCPGMPYKSFYPRQPKSKYDGPVSGAKLVALRTGDTRITEASIPWSEIPWVKKRLDAGETIKFSFRVNDNNGPSYELAHDRSISQENTDSFHNSWAGNHWANEIEFGFAK